MEAKTLLSSVTESVRGEFLKDLYTLTRDKVVGAFNVGDEIEKLSGTVERIKAVLNDAEQRRIIEEDTVLQRLRDYRDIVLDAQDVLEEFRTTEEASRVPGTRKRKRPFYRFAVASQVEDIQRRYNNIHRDKKKLALTHDEAKPKLTRKKDSRPDAEDSSLHNYWKFHGRKDEMDKLVDALKLGDHFNLAVITIEGTGGIGKTALAKAVYAIEDDKLNFDCRIWIDMSGDGFDVPSITRKIINSMSKASKCSLTTLNSLQEHLKTLLRGKRFLLVLDNVAGTSFDQWEKLMAPLIRNEKGSRILVTTRKADVGRDMRATPRICLKDLGKEACWDLFKDYAFAKGEVDESLEVCGREIVDKLGGTPLLVKTIGILLNGVTDKDEWHEFLDITLRVDANNVLLSLKVSYDQLLSHLRRCFEFCSIFPMGYVFDKDELVRFWMALGLVENTNNNSQNRLERIGRKHFDQLLWRSFFQPCDGEGSDRKEYQMPILIHELARDVSVHECFTNVGGDFHGNAAKSRYAFYKEPKTFEKIAEHQCLRALVLHGQDRDRTNLEKILCGSQKKLRFLRVLHLSCNQLRELQDWILELTLLRYLAFCGSQIEQLPQSIDSLFNLETLELNGCNQLQELPESIGNMRHLKYLGLGQTAMVRLPDSLCNITSLQKLDLRDCSSFSKLPNNIGNLEGLTHLHLNNTCIKKFPDSVSKLTKLIVLALRDCYELEELPKGLSRLTNLRHMDLHLDWDKWDRKDLLSFPPEIGQLKYLQTLSRFSVGEERGCGIEQLQNLSSIEGELCISKLENVAKIEEVESAYIGKKSRIELLILRWSACASTDIPDQRQVVEKLHPSTNIKHLWIENYSGADFPSWISDTSFKSLETLRLLECKRCCHLPELGQLPALKSLHIKGLEGINNLEFRHDQFSDRNQSFSSLKTLILSHMSTLSKVEMSGIASLFELSIADCPNLREVKHLPSTLERFELRNCQALDVIEPASSSIHDLTVEKCKGSIFKWIEELNSLSSLTVSQLEAVKLDSQGFQSLRTLKSLKIESCVHLEALSANNSLQNFSSLECLEISSCPEFSFTDGNSLPRTLKEVRLKSCKKLKYLPERPTALKRLVIKDCPDLRRLYKQNGLPFYNFWTTSKWDQVKDIEELDID